MEQRIVEGDYHKWLLKLMNYSFEVQYKAGSENQAADSLSRMPEKLTLAAMTTYFVPDLEEIQQQVDDDSFLSNIKQVIKTDPSAYPHFSLAGDTLLYEGRMVLPADSPAILSLLREFHDSPMGGHGGIRRTYHTIASEFYWKGIKKSVQDYVKACDVCQRHKYDTTIPAGLMQPLPIPQQIWEDVTMDFIEGLPKSKGMDTILVVVDRLSKYSHFIALSHPFSAPTVASKFMTEVVRLHGVPRNVVSDRDKVFMSLFWSELFKLMGTELRRSSAYHPQSDGQSEVVNRCVETYLRCFSADKPTKWSSWLAWTEFNYNSMFHTAAEMTPFRVVYGRDPPPLIPYEKGSAANREVEVLLQERDEMMQELKRHLHQAQQIMKSEYDGKHKEVFFEAGDLVYVKLRPYDKALLQKG